MLKISKFYEYIHDKSVVGMPVRKIGPESSAKSEAEIVEQWPLVQAFGLDCKPFQNIL